MSIVENQQQEIFNVAVERVERAKRELIEIYSRAQENIENKLAALRQRIERGTFNQPSLLTRRAEQLERFIAAIAEDIKTLKRLEYEIILNGYVDNYANTYYATAWSLTNDVNTRILATQGFNYSLEYRKLNLSYITQAYNDYVASAVLGGSVKQRTLQEILLLQSNIRKTVAQAIAEGISPRKAIKRLKDLDIVFEQSLNRAFTVARTEILRGYSFGNLDAIDAATDAGLKGAKVWDATLDGFTRPDHQKMDQKKADNEGFFTLPNGDRAQGPRLPGLSASQSVNCRCGFFFLPEGVTPNTRGRRLADGTWMRGNYTTYQEWAESLQGKRSIEAAETYRRKRAARLAKLRRDDKPATLIPPISKRLRQV
jgi:hypothetical protein